MYGQRIGRVVQQYTLRARQATWSPRSATYELARRRMMSTDAPAPRHKFIVYAPDMTDEGALQRRLSVRPAHLEKAAEYIDGGMFKVAGAMLTPESIASPTAEKKMVGSVFICEAESLEEVRKVMESDVYYTSGVWDKEKLVILPIALATKTL